MNTETEKPGPVDPIVKLKPGIESLKAELVGITTPMKTALTVLKDIKDDKTDAWAEQALVKGGAKFKEAEEHRKGFTRKVDALTAELMEPEKELKAELDRIRSLRNAYANEKAKVARDKAAEIEKEKVYKIHETEVKAEMKAALEYGIATKITNLEKFIADMFAKMSLDEKAEFHYNKIAKALGFKPTLKPDFVETLLNTVPYNKEIMSEDQFKALKDRALAYPDWSYDNIQAKYLREALLVVEKWRAQIMPRVRDLETLAKGGAAAEKVKSRVDNQAAQDAQAIASAAGERSQQIESTKAVEVQEGSLSAEFKAQVQTQEIEDVTGRKKRVYRIDPKVEKDFIKVANLIGRMALHVFTETGRKSVYKLDDAGYPKRDEKGDPIYIDGISFYLKELSSLPYNPKIEGLVMTEEITTVAKKK